MKPPLFRYYDPETAEEAVTLLAEHGDGAKVLAGGQSLVPMMSLRLAYPDALVDINRVSELDYVARRDGQLAIGALTRHTTLERSPDLARGCPLVAAAMPWVAHEAIRNRGTIGGSLAHADPAAELPAVALALDATLVATSRDGTREIPIEDFFTMPFVSALQDGELLTEVRLPVQPESSGCAVQEVARRHGDFALAGVAATVVLENGAVARAGVVSFATGPTPVRLAAVERAVAGTSADVGDLAEVADLAGDEVAPTSDVHASADYRRRVTKVLTARALRGAIDDARRRAEEGSR
jgi:aerobic carbon-monoxide dehydrogenase medium subunit